MQAIASGSPAGVYETVSALTTADPDHNKIYLVSADGHWYYYNNEWWDGGVYQAAEDSETVAVMQKDIETIYKYEKYINISNWEIGTITGSGDAYNKYRIRSVNITDIPNNTLKYKVNSGYRFAISVYDDNGNFDRSYAWTTGEGEITVRTRHIRVVIDTVAGNIDATLDFKNQVMFTIDNSLINDSTSSLKETYSSNKIESIHNEINNNIDNLINDNTQSIEKTYSSNKIENMYAEISNNISLTNPLLKYNNFKYIAHQCSGYSKVGQTIEGLRVAKMMGYNIIECDIQITQDNHLVIYHDNDLSTKTNGEGAIEDVTLNYIKSLNVTTSYYNNVKIPTLEEFLKECKILGIFPVLEIKNEEKTCSDNELYSSKVLNTVKSLLNYDEYVIISFSQTILSNIRSIDDVVWLGALANSSANLTNLLTYTRTLGKNAFVNIQYTNASLTQEVIDTFHENNYLVLVWTIDDITDANSFLNMKVDFITTNYIKNDYYTPTKYSRHLSSSDGFQTTQILNQGLQDRASITTLSNTTISNKKCLTVSFDEINIGYFKVLFPSIIVNTKNVYNCKAYFNSSLNAIVIHLYDQDYNLIDIDTLNNTNIQLDISVLF